MFDLEVFLEKFELAEKGLVNCQTAPTARDDHRPVNYLEHSVGFGNGNGISYSQTNVVINVASMENKISANHGKSEIKHGDPGT